MTRRIDDAFGPLARYRAAGLEDLLALQWEEVAEPKAGLPFQVDWLALRDLESQGILKVLGAWADAELVGVAAFNVVRPRMAAGICAAAEETLYVLPEHRGFLGLGLIAMAEKLLWRMGVTLVSISSRPAAPSLGDVLDKLGYRTSEVIHTKVLT